MNKYIKWFYLGCIGIGVLFVLFAMMDAADSGDNLSVTIGGGFFMALGLAVYILNKN